MRVNRWNWKLALFSAFFFTLFLYLGVWQTQRHEEKQVLLSRQAALHEMPGKRLDVFLDGIRDIRSGEPVALVGSFLDEPWFLLDNRTLNGRVGYEALRLFLDDSGLVVLVNLGFLPAGRTRTDLPVKPKVPEGRTEIRGHVYVNTTQVPEAFVSPQGPPWVLQVAEPALLHDMVDEALFLHVVRLHGEAEFALPRYWPVTTISPERHQGYAVTWFTMALAVLIAFAVFTFGKNRREHRHD